MRPKRKNLRLPGYDYGRAGYYFITLCAHDRKHIFGEVVGADVLIGPHVSLTPLGRLVEQTLSDMPAADKYVVMPNHIHVIFRVPRGGPIGTLAPTVPGLVRYLKRRATQACGDGIWQRSYYDHILRDEQDYLRACRYIDANPAKWTEDRYFEGADV